MSGLFGSPPPAPAVPMPAVTPSMDSATVQARAEEALKMKRGRASTMLTNPLTQTDAGPSRQKTLGD